MIPQRHLLALVPDQYPAPYESAQDAVANPGLYGFGIACIQFPSSAFEFRDPSWHTQEVYDLLAARRLAFCQFEIAGLQTPDVLTGDLVYVRLHGPGPDAYRGSYGHEVLRAWAARIGRWRSDGRRV